MTPAATQRWIEAAKVLADDPSVAVRCPERGDGVLEVQDVVLPDHPTRLERWLVCDRCGATDAILMRVPAEQVPSRGSSSR